MNEVNCPRCSLPAEKGQDIYCAKCNAHFPADDRHSYPDLAIGEIRKLDKRCWGGCGGWMKVKLIFVSTGAMISGYNYKSDRSDLIIDANGTVGKYIEDWFCEKCGGSWCTAGSVIAIPDILKISCPVCNQEIRIGKNRDIELYCEKCDIYMQPPFDVVPITYITHP